MTPRDVLTRLDALPPVDLPAVALVLWLLEWDGETLDDCPLSVANDAELFAACEQAQAALAQYAGISGRFKERCVQQWQPIPAPQPPVGF
ncbi:MAG TPA: hypothetical protein PKH77_04975 [Anaerolineae bacterium]|nr:hypothetical protein [Anaerolineae bacterium]